MTYGEYMKGVVQGEKNILFVNMAWGLGLGIIIDGNLYYGNPASPGSLDIFACSKTKCYAIAARKAVSKQRLPDRLSTVS